MVCVNLKNIRIYVRSVYSNNEWDPLHKIVVGTATNAHWPVRCKGFRSLEETTRWQESPVPRGDVPDEIIHEANANLAVLCSVLRDFEVQVVRPKNLDFSSFDGMYNYCPRDRVLIIGDKVINCPMMFPCRMPEILALQDYLGEVITCDDETAFFDAANVCRLGKDLLYLVSDSGNIEGAGWLQRILGDDYKVHVIENVYQGVHIDSTIVPLREGLVMLNGDRLNKDTCPDVLKSWDKIWITKEDIESKDFYQYPYASDYIAMNVLSINESNVICDTNQRLIRDKIEKNHISTYGVEMTHSRTLGGGHHCVTLDLQRW